MKLPPTTNKANIALDAIRTLEALITIATRLAAENEQDRKLLREAREYVCFSVKGSLSLGARNRHGESLLARIDAALSSTTTDKEPPL